MVSFLSATPPPYSNDVALNFQPPLPPPYPPAPNDQPPECVRRCQYPAHPPPLFPLHAHPTTLYSPPTWPDSASSFQSMEEEPPR